MANALGMKMPTFRAMILHPFLKSLIENSGKGISENRLLSCEFLFAACLAGNLSRHYTVKRAVAIVEKLFSSEECLRPDVVSSLVDGGAFEEDIYLSILDDDDVFLGHIPQTASYFSLNSINVTAALSAFRCYVENFNIQQTSE
ncbi:MAG: hypothetical protein CMF31_05165 [Kordiimonas sp.]|nr:hypothetical protein [Kordiimonas sp.]